MTLLLSQQQEIDTLMIWATTDTPWRTRLTSPSTVISESVKESNKSQIRNAQKPRPQWDYRWKQKCIKRRRAQNKSFGHKIIISFSSVDWNIICNYPPPFTVHLNLLAMTPKMIVNVLILTEGNMESYIKLAKLSNIVYGILLKTIIHNMYLYKLTI